MVTSKGDTVAAVPLWQLKIINIEHVKYLESKELNDSLIIICNNYSIKLSYADSALRSFQHERELYEQRIALSDSAYTSVLNENHKLLKRNKNLILQRNLLILAALILGIL